MNLCNSFRYILYMKKVILILVLGLIIFAACNKDKSTNPVLTDPITITSPSNNSAVVGVVTVRTVIGEDYDIISVTFYVDGTAVHTDSISPFTYQWDTGVYESGTIHTLRARAYDDSTSYLSKSISVTVTAPGDNEFVYLSDFTMPSPAIRLATEHDNLYVAVGTSGLRVLNFSDPDSPRGIYQFSGGGDIQGLDASSSYLVSAELDNGIRLFNISDPDTALVESQFNTAGRAWNVKISGNIVYVADNDGAQIVSISNYDFDSITRIPISSGLVKDIDAAGSILYILDLNGVTAYNVSQPSNPLFLARFVGFNGQCQAVSAYGDYVFVATTAELRILSHDLDSSLATFSTQNGFTGVYAGQSVVFACQGGSGGRTMAFDYSSGHSLDEIDSYLIEELCYDVNYYDNLVFVATQTKIVIFRFNFVASL